MNARTQKLHFPNHITTKGFAITKGCTTSFYNRHVVVKFLNKAQIWKHRNKHQRKLSFQSSTCYCAVTDHEPCITVTEYNTEFMTNSLLSRHLRISAICRESCNNSDPLSRNLPATQAYWQTDFRTHTMRALPFRFFDVHSLSLSSSNLSLI